LLSVRHGGGRRGDAMNRAERRSLLVRVYETLLQVYGPQHWWPAETPFEVIVGAILTQNTAWKNVEKAMSALRNNGFLSFQELQHIPVADLAPMIRSSGYYNQKAGKLKTFCSYVGNHWQGDLEAFLDQDMAKLRNELIQLRGIGPETADSIVLYAAEQPSFVVDVYTYRVLSRHGWVPEQLAYDDLRDFFMDCLPRDVSLYKEYHALLVQVGHHHCRRRPSCTGCPLESFRP
jgi:endonuclease III related protein